jgi:hypothetical protein
MRRTLSLGVVALALSLGIPAIAEAHHLDQDTSTIACILVNNVPTIQTRAVYVDFSDWDKPVSVVETIDKATVFSGPVSWPGPNYTHALDIATTPGMHDVVYQANWNNGANGGYLSRTVDCPASVPPPTYCNGAPMPPGSSCAPPPPVVCSGVVKPAGTVCAPPPKTTPPPKKHPKPRCVPTAHPKIKVYPRKLKHGEVLFTVTGVRKAAIRAAHWYVRRPGHAWKRVGTSGKPWERMAHKGLSWHIYLWVEQVWGYPQWGKHQVKFTGREKTACGYTPFGAQKDYFNQDPAAWAHNL